MHANNSENMLSSVPPLSRVGFVYPFLSKPVLIMRRIMILFSKQTALRMQVKKQAVTKEIYNT